MTNAEINVELSETVSADWQAVPNEGIDADIVGGVMLKGVRSDNEKPGYQAVVNGVSTEVKAGFKPALVAGLALANVVAENYEFPAKWTDIHQTNKPKEPETFDELSKEDQKLFEKGYKAISSAQAAEVKADENRLDKACKLADVVHDVRDGMDSYKWRLFGRLCKDETLKEFLGKNTVGEAYKASSLRKVEGFDLSEHIGARVSGNKGIVSAYQSAVNMIAVAIVSAVQSDEAREAIGIDAKSGDSDGVREALGYFIDEGGFGVTPSGKLTEIDNGSMSKLALLVAPLHYDNIPDGSLFEVKDSRYRVAKGDDKQAVAKCLFGLEGDDELLAAIARKFSDTVTKAATAEVADAAGAMVKEARETKLGFADWPADRAARHLANILFARWPEDGSKSDQDAASADLEEILGMMGGFVDEVVAGNLAVADVLAPDAAEDADDAEDDADADMTE